MNVSAYYTTSPVSDSEQFKVLDRAVELGATFWTTSDVYNESEFLLGSWFTHTSFRPSIFLATKFGYEHNKAGAFP
jgi:aryl-alcohol dehydrogenase-like predicted oxidoreductase